MNRKKKWPKFSAEQRELARMAQRARRFAEEARSKAQHAKAAWKQARDAVVEAKRAAKRARKAGEGCRDVLQARDDQEKEEEKALGADATNRRRP